MDNSKNLNFSINLKKYRNKKKLSQDELAYRTETTKTSIYNYEKGISYPTIEFVYKVCDVLDITPNNLFLDAKSCPFGTDKIHIDQNEITKKDIATTVIQCLNIETYFEHSFLDKKDSIYPKIINHVLCLEIKDKDIVSLSASFLENRKIDVNNAEKEVKKKLGTFEHLTPTKTFSGFDEEF